MREFLILFALIISLNAQEISENYQKAMEFESKKDYENAMFFYKKDAQIYNSQNSNLNQHRPVNLPFIQTHKENYVLPVSFKNLRDNQKNPETKFQFSVKKKLLSEIFGYPISINGAYTQVSWWQIAKESAPFRETNYMPEIFFEIPINGGIIPLDGFDLGFIHQSNGRDGANSRSWNRVYLQTIFNFNNLQIIPKAWLRLDKEKNNELDDNPYIEHYAGHGSLEINYNFGDYYTKLSVANNFHFNNTNRGNVELSVYIPIIKDLAYGMIQFFNGYHESMIDYDKSTNRIGLGFLIFR